MILDLPTNEAAVETANEAKEIAESANTDATEAKQIAQEAKDEIDKAILD
jgi:hypothetical protein